MANNQKGKGGSSIPERDWWVIVPKIGFGILFLCLGILFFTNQDLLSQALLYLSVYVLGILFFFVGGALIVYGAWLLLTAFKPKSLKPEAKPKRRWPWLDLLMAVLFVFSLGVLLSSGTENADQLYASNIANFYNGKMEQLAPNTSAGYTLHVTMLNNVSVLGGGFLAMMFVGVGNTIGLGLTGTRIIFAILMVICLAVLLRNPVRLLIETINRIKIERASAKAFAPTASSKDSYNMRKKQTNVDEAFREAEKRRKETGGLHNKDPMAGAYISATIYDDPSHAFSSEPEAEKLQPLEHIDASSTNLLEDEKAPKPQAKPVNPVVPAFTDTKMIEAKAPEQKPKADAFVEGLFKDNPQQIEFKAKGAKSDKSGDFSDFFDDAHTLSDAPKQVSDEGKKSDSDKNDDGSLGSKETPSDPKGM